LICNPLKLARPSEEDIEVLPAAKLPEDRATPIVSVDPVFPVVTVLPYWSSTVTLTETVPPAVIEDAGWVVTASLYSAAGFTVTFGWAAMAVRAPPDPSCVSVVKAAVPAPVWATAFAYLTVNDEFAAQDMGTVIVELAIVRDSGAHEPLVVVT
jgi:hypothetical protein